MLSIFNNKPQSPEEHILSEEKHPPQIASRSQGITEIAPRLIDFKYIAESHSENDFFDVRQNESCTYVHNINKAGLTITIKIPGQNVKASFEFDSTGYPEVTQIINRREQSISCGFGTPNTPDYKEVQRYKREIMTREYTIMGISLVDYLRSNTHLPSVSDFLKLCGASSKTCTRDIPTQSSCNSRPSGPG